MSSSFAYHRGMLCAEEVPLDKIAAEVGTPFYCYSTAQLQQNYRDFAAPFAGMKATVYFANKANANQAVIRTFAECGTGADITSVGELERALAAGVSPQKIIYSGVGKRADEIVAALQAGIYQINIESVPELQLVNKTADELKKRAPIALRVNPDVVARTHKKLATGELGTKFGIDIAQLDEAMQLATTLPHLDFKGFHVHVGSHTYDYEPFRDAYAKIAELVNIWRGKGIRIERLDLGSGVGISYDGRSVAPFAEYVAIVKETVGNSGCELGFEPGKRLVGTAGVLVSRVIYDKQGHIKRFLILDAAMNDLIRSAMYGARHSIIPVREATDAKTPLADVVGPVCETADLFGEDYRLPGVGAGDFVAILQAGAYGSAMASTYNGRPLIPEVIVSGNRFAVVRRRISVAEQIGWESLPPWLEAGIRGPDSSIRK
jgi:diaminopimelate decarboxylase